MEYNMNKNKNIERKIYDRKNRLLVFTRSSKPTITYIFTK